MIGRPGPCDLSKYELLQIMGHKKITIIVVDIPFPIGHRELFTDMRKRLVTQSLTFLLIVVLNFSCV